MKEAEIKGTLNMFTFCLHCHPKITSYFYGHSLKSKKTDINPGIELTQ